MVTAEECAMCEACSLLLALVVVAAGAWIPGSAPRGAFADVAAARQATGTSPAAPRGTDAPPPGYLPPPLNPSGVTLETRRLAEGVYALVANTPFTDNSGFVVGTDAVLVIDSQFN